MNSGRSESTRIWAAGYVVRDAARRPSNWRSERTLDEELVGYGIVGIRAWTPCTDPPPARSSRHSPIFSGDDAAKSDAELIEIVKARPSMAGRNISAEVSVSEAYIVEPADHGYTGEAKHTVAAIDLGMKSVLHRLAERGLRVHVLP